MTQDSPKKKHWGITVTQYKLKIFEDDSGSWTGLANLGSDIEPEPQRVFADYLEELRELVQDGVNGDLEIEGISFEEAFLTKSEATS
ncbi:MAG: hypothetical protein Q8K86_06610 [Candidatus Nanopelagicaceae bacterium]|nr:hypothetical protein [Candidatus Nanopelagicaceae bacterium]